MSYPIQPTPLQTASFSDLFERLSTISDANPSHLSSTLTDMLQTYVAKFPKQAREAIEAVGQLQTVLIALANNGKLLDYGKEHFMALSENCN